MTFASRKREPMVSRAAAGSCPTGVVFVDPSDLFMRIRNVGELAGSWLGDDT